MCRSTTFQPKVAFETMTDTAVCWLGEMPGMPESEQVHERLAKTWTCFFQLTIIILYTLSIATH